MSNDFVLSILLTMAGPLLGAVVGGLATYFVMSRVEHQKWRQERHEKFLSLKRDALAAALEWIEPMRNAESRASSLVMAVISGDIDDEHFLERFPYLLGELVTRDLPANQRAVLPDGVYVRGHRIRRKLDEVRYLGVRHGQEAKLRGKPYTGFQECSDKLNAISQQIEGLETDLREAFRKTFE